MSDDDRNEYIVEWNIPDEVNRDKYDQSKIDSLDIYPEVEGVEWKSTYLSDDMDKCYCIYEAEDEDAVERAREAVGAPIDEMHSFEKMTEEDVEEMKEEKEG